MKRCSVVLGLCLAGVIATPEVAQACMHGKSRVRQVDPVQQDVQRAEHLLARGDHAGAVRVARRPFNDIQRLSPSSGGSRTALLVRAQRVVALAAVRTDGAVGPKRATKKRGASASAAHNKTWATVVLQHHAALEPDNTVRQTEYAEALAAMPFMGGVALNILTRLADEDLMPTARGYVLLARLQKDHGDENGSAHSLARCNDISHDSDTCRVA